MSTSIPEGNFTAAVNPQGAEGSIEAGNSTMSEAPEGLGRPERAVALQYRNRCTDTPCSLANWAWVSPLSRHFATHGSHCSRPHPAVIILLSFVGDFAINQYLI
jgi:hypothetical protein